MLQAATEIGAPAGRRRLGPHSIAFWFFVAVLAWAPFPLGSNRPWSWCLLGCLVAVAWLLWWIASLPTGRENWDGLKRFPVPLMLALAVLLWAAVQIAPQVPAGWKHPLWSLASDALGKPIKGAISINPWHTITEAAKLAGYMTTAALALFMCRRTERAKTLIHALVAIGSAYAAYAAIIAFLGITQFQIFYGRAPTVTLVSGPFVLHNSYATFCGLITLAAIGCLFQAGSQAIVTTRGPRILALTLVNFLAFRGSVLLIAIILNFSLLIASASRGGFAATMVGLAVMALLAAFRLRRTLQRGLAVAASLAVALLLIVLLSVGGDSLAHRLDLLVETSPNPFEVSRISLWQAGERMISDAPLLGLGLGTFEDAYPLYADHVLPFVVDKAHNDYIELAAGLGLPAAIAWWSALVLIVARCIHGVFVRQRNTLYPLLAVSASALVGFHSLVDFSLQIPAISLIYAAILGAGAAQAFPSVKQRSWRQPDMADQKTSTVL